MAKKSIPKTPKKGTGKATTKKPARVRKGRDEKGKFTEDNKAAERWTEETVLPILESMWKKLTTDSEGDPPPDGNVVRANDIKLLGEICLSHSVSKQRWNEWEDKFAEYLKPDESGKAEKNPRYSEPVIDLIKNIKWLLECRLNYSGGTMDIFILKNHYQYGDQSQVIAKVDATTKGESLNNPFYELLKATGITGSSSEGK